MEQPSLKNVLLIILGGDERNFDKLQIVAKGPYLRVIQTTARRLAWLFRVIPL